MKGLSKGRYDETFAGEDAQPVVSVIYWLTNLLAAVSDMITIEPTLLFNHNEATVRC